MGWQSVPAMRDWRQVDHLTRLLLDARDGDRRALERFVAETQGDVWRLCRYLGDNRVADDLAQETYERATGSLHRYRAEGPARGGNRRRGPGDPDSVNPSRMSSTSLHGAPSRVARGAPFRLTLGALFTVLIAVGASACGGSGSELSEVAQRGKDTANSNGCAGCHGANGQGGVGPSWVDLAGSEVELEDGTTVTADRGYLHRSIVEPDAEEVEGYTLKMPVKSLSDAQVDDIIAYIEELKSEPTS